MKNVAISGWELNLPSIVNFEQLSEQLLLKEQLKQRNTSLMIIL